MRPVIHCRAPMPPSPHRRRAARSGEHLPALRWPARQCFARARKGPKREPPNQGPAPRAAPEAAHWWKRHRGRAARGWARRAFSFVAAAPSVRVDPFCLSLGRVRSTVRAAPCPPAAKDAVLHEPRAARVASSAVDAGERTKCRRGHCAKTEEEPFPFRPGRGAAPSNRKEDRAVRAPAMLARPSPEAVLPLAAGGAWRWGWRRGARGSRRGAAGGGGGGGGATRGGGGATVMEAAS